MKDGDLKSSGTAAGVAKPAAEDWPNPVRTREELDAALEAGLASGESPYRIDEVAERILNRLKNG